MPMVALTTCALLDMMMRGPPPAAAVCRGGPVVGAYVAPRQHAEAAKKRAGLSLMLNDKLSVRCISNIYTSEASQNHNPTKDASC